MNEAMKDALMRAGIEPSVEVQEECRQFNFIPRCAADAVILQRELQDRYYQLLAFQSAKPFEDWREKWLSDKSLL